MAVYKRGATYWIDFYDASGKRYRRPAGENRKLAQTALDTIRAAIAAGTWSPEATERKPVPTFADAAEAYIADREQRGKRFESYEGLGSFWCPLFGKRPVDAIDAEAIRAALEREAKRSNWQPATYNNRLAVLSGMLGWCARAPRLWIASNPARLVERKATDNARTRWLRAHEVEAVRDASPPWLAAIIDFATRTGMRLGELCSLTRANYHTDGDGNAWLTVERTKNGRPLHWPLVGHTRAMVEPRVSRCPFPASYIFPGPHGGNARTSIVRALPEAIRAAGMVYGRGARDGVTFHSFRHSMASLALANGVPEHVVQEMGNWRTRQMVARYGHVADAEKRAAVAKLDAVLSIGRGHNTVTDENQTTPKPQPRDSEVLEG